MLLSVPAPQRSQGELEVNTRARVLTVYTLKVLENEKWFPKTQAAFIAKLQDCAIEIQALCWEANGIRVDDDADRYKRRLELQILQIIVGGIEVRAIKVQTLLSEKAEMENALAQANVAAGRCEKLVDDIVFVTLCESGMIDDVTATEHTDVFSQWEPGVAYTVGNIRTYGEKLYKCVQAHTSQTDWTPDAVPALWTHIGDPADEWPEWSQPIGAHDAYQIGDKVSCDGKHWVSNTANNVWKPGVYGWVESAGTD